MSKCVVACSGGPDSMALLDQLNKQGKDIVVAHVNYKHRDTADRDENIVKDYCKKYDIPIKRFEQSNNVLFVSLEVESGTYSTFVCVSYYEMLCKYILFVRAILKNRNLKVK